MKWREGEFTGVADLALYRQAWVPDGEARSVAVLVHGLAEHSGRYPHVAARLVTEGHAVHALDHRGHGRSGGPRALIDRFDHVVRDLDKLVDAAASAHPDVPVVMLGHSVGGLVATYYALEQGERLAALALSGWPRSKPLDRRPAWRRGCSLR